ncbi:MAG TPA: sigma 54-interacting transcriptional regulator [Spirochaetota bacterium]|nr:sigma 54-interacting transcriptional regulator [Spirochaetota bacterium]HPF06154.1 sigma 54-interacting transcriptional regulator [Spirochaetota bacterium]HPJ41308.1 sigma 54-interacting transcriptional regulator [Spirochaetota bacterium]HPR37042.1 sigma 54-interacting transcriptional regulator [Spirochaetota bacterium]HRX46683.1 sigma 54-interacting transcriptional regulator [Spirochaetota bacterium]
MDYSGNRESGLLEAIGREFISSNKDINVLLNNVFNIIVSYYSIERGMISIYHKDADEISVDIHYGYTGEEVERGVYRPGEGIIGTVVQTGTPIVIPDIRNEPRFLNRTGANRNIFTHRISFICIPIIIDNNVIGAISVDIINNSGRDVAEEFHMLTTISIMISQAVNSRMEILAREKRLKLENEELRRKVEAGNLPVKIIGKSREIRDLYEKILLVAGTDSTVLISGESGTGKELIADAIYENSKRAGRPYVKVNIASLPKTLIESELFGYEKGAFTGADKTRKGRFEMAEGGTIFIDEIGDLDLHLQVHLLRVLQNRTIERIGGSETIPIDVRVIAATHHDLEKRISEGSFRSDLFYRLNVFPLLSPPLRERKADIMLLADHFLEFYASRMGKDIKRISTDAIDLLVSYHWPGNVRELENCIERSVILCIEDTIRSFHLPPSLQKAGNIGSIGTLEERTEQFEREIIIDSMKVSKGNISRSAMELGTTKRILGYKMAKYGIDYRLFRNGDEV